MAAIQGHRPGRASSPPTTRNLADSGCPHSGNLDDLKEMMSKISVEELKFIFSFTNDSNEESEPCLNFDKLKKISIFSLLFRMRPYLQD